jgi:hypothetical protein
MHEVECCADSNGSVSAMFLFAAKNWISPRSDKQRARKCRPDKSPERKSGRRIER